MDNSQDSDNFHNAALVEVSALSDCSHYLCIIYIRDGASCDER